MVLLDARRLGRLPCGIGCPLRLMTALCAATFLLPGLPTSWSSGLPEPERAVSTRAPLSSELPAPVDPARVPPAVRLPSAQDMALLQRLLVAARQASQDGRLAEERVLRGHLETILTVTYGPDHPFMAANLVGLANTYRREGRYADAEPPLRRALAIREQVLGPMHRDTAESLRSLGNTVYELGDHAEAEGLLRQALAIQEAARDVSQPDLAGTLNDLALAIYQQGRARQAEPLYRRALAIREASLGRAHIETAATLNNLALALEAQGRHREAEPLLRRALNIRVRRLGPDHPQVAHSLNSLALSLGARGHFSGAELLLRRALEIRERALGPDHPGTALSLNNLAGNLGHQDRHGEAEPLLRRALAIREQAQGTDHADTAQSLNNLAMNLSGQDQHEEAEPLLRRALTIRRQVLGPGHPSTAQSLNNLAANLDNQRRHSEAEPLYREALAIYAGLHGSAHPETASTLNNLARNLDDRGLHEEAEPLYRQALAIYASTFGYQDPRTAFVAWNLGFFELRQGEPWRALEPARRALGVRSHVEGREEIRHGEAMRDRLAAETGNAAWLVVRAAWEAARQGGGTAAGDRPDALRIEAFEAAQRLSASGAGEALTRSAARAAADIVGLADTTRAWEAALEQRASLDRDFADAVGDRSETGESRRAALLARRGGLDREIAQLEARLRIDFPAFFDLVRPEPVSVAALQAESGSDGRLLDETEALILLTPGRQVRGLSFPGIVWGITRDSVAWAEIPMSPNELRAAITRLRDLLDGGGTTRAPLTGGSGLVGAGGRGYDRAEALRIYEALFGAPQIAALIADKPDWILSPQGPLLSLPFAALVTESFSGDDADPAALRATSWLGLERSLSVVPSVSNLRSLRVLQRPDRQSGTPFFGLGDPAFEGAAGGDHGAPVDGFEAPRSSQGARGNVHAVRMLTPLPGTREEILALAAMLGAGPNSYVLGPAATETELRRRNSDGRLSEARIIALATHGLLAGAFSGTLAEPALALSPPDEASSEDDGLLTASEAAALHLSADWVILSACNTAAGGEPGAAGLSGLASAFFYAGADALLVSHWRVRDDAAARLTTRTFEIAAARPEMTRAQAFQASMRDLMNDTSADATGASFAHPAAWAPFALIGVERPAP